MYLLDHYTLLNFQKIIGDVLLMLLWHPKHFCVSQLPPQTHTKISRSPPHAKSVLTVVTTAKQYYSGLRILLELI
jgi:hypothetical protein